MRIGVGLNPSTFGAVGDESKGGALYSTCEWSVFTGNLGGNAESFRPKQFGIKGFIYYWE